MKNETWKNMLQDFLEKIAKNQIVVKDYSSPFFLLVDLALKTFILHNKII